jgi:hypothetical protein
MEIDNFEYKNSRQYALSYIDRYVPNDVIMTYKGRSSIVKILIHPPENHPEKSQIIRTLYAVEVICFNGVSRWFGFHIAFIDSRLRVRVSGYSEMFNEVKSWELAPKE